MSGALWGRGRGVLPGRSGGRTVPCSECPGRAGALVLQRVLLGATGALCPAALCAAAVGSASPCSPNCKGPEQGLCCFWEAFASTSASVLTCS